MLPPPPPLPNVIQSLPGLLVLMYGQSIITLLFVLPYISIVLPLELIILFLPLIITSPLDAKSITSAVDVLTHSSNSKTVVSEKKPV